jgi:hypothetical protein
MPKSTTSQSKSRKPRAFNPMQPLECRHYHGRSEIVACIDAGSEWRIVAEFRTVSGISPEIMAKYVCQLINDNLNRKDILLDAMDALRLCLTEASMTFSTEQAADCVLTRIQRVSL